MTASTQRQSESFPKRVRLLRRPDFERAYDFGRRHFSPLFTAFYLLRTNDAVTGPRLGFTVSRALAMAHDRNRMRRRLREAVRLNLASLSKPVDVVLNPKKSVLEADFAALLDEVRKAFAVIEEKAAPAREVPHPPPMRRKKR